MEEIVNYLKEKDLDLYEKMRQTRLLVRGRFSEEDKRKPDTESGVKD